MIRVNEIKQLDNGVQKRPYADHIYKWQIDARGNGSINREEMLEFCQNHLRSAKREKSEYLAAIRDHSIGFNEHMEIVCGHYYTLESDKYGVVWTYTVIEEYID